MAEDNPSQGIFVGWLAMALLVVAVVVIGVFLIAGTMLPAA